MSHRILVCFPALVLTASLLFGCKSDKTPTKVTPRPAPEAEFTFNGSRYAPSDITFVNQSENANRFYWEFGDSTVSNIRNPIHTYRNEGEYEIRLTATDTVAGVSDTCIRTVSLLPTPPPPPPPDPVASFTWIGSTQAPAAIRFVNNSQNANAYLWDFSEGRTSTAANPSMYFSTFGTYTITLIATNTTTAKSDTAQHLLNIGAAGCYIDSLYVDSISFVDSLGRNWDANNGPDLFYNLRDHNSVLLATTIGSPINNIGPDILPIGWELPDSLMLDDWENSYRVEIFDLDNADADDRIELIRFNLNNLVIESGYRRSYVCRQGGVSIRIVLMWE